jgi:hypothetical protein
LRPPTSSCTRGARPARARRPRSVPLPHLCCVVASPRLHARPGPGLHLRPPTPCRPPRRLLACVQDAWAALAPALPPDSDAARGAELLAQLLARVWYAPGASAGAGAAGAAAPSDAGAGAPGAAASAAPPGGPLFVPELEASLARRRDLFDPLVAFARRAAGLELRRHEAAYAPFIAGCGAGYAGLSFSELCARHVEAMGQEVEQLQMAALAAAMGVTVGVLDVAGSEAGMVTHPAGAGEPLFYLIHLPGAEGAGVWGGPGWRRGGEGKGARGRGAGGARHAAAKQTAGGGDHSPPLAIDRLLARLTPPPPAPRASPGHYEICYRA